ncbi:hypothetical protein BGX33_007809 [Mortierella sp. NVP41]|nr:hypothetical protein BGX33_007809 [Mortierella sp. NVP41]
MGRLPFKIYRFKVYLAKPQQYRHPRSGTVQSLTKHLQAIKEIRSKKLIEALETRIKGLQQSIQQIRSRMAKSRTLKWIAAGSLGTVLASLKHFFKAITTPTVLLPPSISRAKTSNRFKMTSITVIAALILGDQNIFSISVEWDTQSQAESTTMSSRTSEPTDKQSFVFATKAQQEFETQSVESEHEINQNRQFQMFLRRFGGNRKSRE